jgi:Rrf2 family transcriptional regulator, cysteine metabolism repressor
MRRGNVHNPDRLGRVSPEAALKLTTRSEYALLALVHLARHEGAGYLSVQSIAEAKGIPAKFLEQILLTLKHARYVRSLKGQRGGYRLARPAGKVSLAEVIRLFDGALAPTESVSKYFYESTPIEKERSLLKVFKQIRDMVSAKLEQTTLADVA